MLGNLLAKRPFSPRPRFAGRKVLVLAKSYDPEVNSIGIELRRRGIEYVRVNSDDMQQARITYNIGQDSRIGFSIRNQVVYASEISAVLLRDFDIKEAGFSGDKLASIFSAQQWNDAFQTFQGGLRCEWINDPRSCLNAGDRRRQFAAARAAGFSIPPTLITNDPDAARGFCRSHRDVIIKALHHHGVEFDNRIHSMYARKLRKQDLARLGDLVYAPCVLQKRIQKKSELRVTVVGDQIFAAELGPRHIIVKSDDIHRHFSDSLAVRACRLENSTAKRCVNLVKSLGFKYGAIDLLLDKDDELVFLEINPVGDWRWVEARTGLGITRAIADLIEQAVRVWPRQ